MRATDSHRTRSLGRLALRALVPTTLVAALGAAAVLTFTELPSVPVAEAAGRIDAAAAAPVVPRTLVPLPPLPDQVIPDLPLPVPATEEPEPETAVAYTCDPSADPEFGDPDNPNLITNKDCPEITAAKEQAQREYLKQLNSDVVVGDSRESTCSDPSSSDYGTAACGTDADGDGLMDGGPLDID